MGLQRPRQDPRGRLRPRAPPGFRWLHERFGSNFRLTELQSAIGRIQLQRLPEWTAARTRHALLLAEALGDLSAVRVPLPPAGIEHAWYKFYAFVEPEALALGWIRDRILSEVTEAGYPAFRAAAVRSTWNSVSRMQA